MLKVDVQSHSIPMTLGGCVQDKLKEYNDLQIMVNLHLIQEATKDKMFNVHTDNFVFCK